MPASDEKVWAEYTKTVKRLARQNAKDAAAQPYDGGKAGAKKTAALPPPLPQRISGVNKHKARPALTPLDKKTERRLRQGATTLEARLDLHGLTREKAFTALTRFVETQAAQGKRRLLVITGKGPKGESVLRASLPRWCAEPPVGGYVLSLLPAAPKHGGGGAWYVVLRRQKD
jgi:DNA-nicking Smr family endonuclease